MHLLHLFLALAQQLLAHTPTHFLFYLSKLTALTWCFTNKVLMPRVRGEAHSHYFMWLKITEGLIFRPHIFR